MTEPETGPQTTGEPRSITDEERAAAFEAYALAVGRLSYAWNDLHVTLGELFAFLLGADDEGVALAVWYSTENDRAQRNMLRAAVEAAKLDRWKATPKAPDEVKWVLDRVDGELAEARNNGVHAPCAFYVAGSREAMFAEVGTSMQAAFVKGKHRTRRLLGKRLIPEFEWCAGYADALRVFTHQLHSAIAFPANYPWPPRPLLPTRDAPIPWTRPITHGPPPAAESRR